MQFGFIKWEPRDFEWEPPWEPFLSKKLGKLAFSWKVQLVHIMQLDTVEYALNKKIQPIFISWISTFAPPLGLEPRTL